MANKIELSQYKQYENQNEYFGYFATKPHVCKLVNEILKFDTNQFTIGNITSNDNFSISHKELVTAKTTSALGKIKYNKYGHITGFDDINKFDVHSILGKLDIIDSSKVNDELTNDDYLIRKNSSDSKLIKISDFQKYFVSNLEKLIVKFNDTDKIEYNCSEEKTIEFTETRVNTLLNKLTQGISVPEDDDYYISQYADGGTEHLEFRRRPISKLWEYIKSKIKDDDITLKNKLIVKWNETEDFKYDGSSEKTLTITQDKINSIYDKDGVNTFLKKLENISSTEVNFIGTDKLIIKLTTADKFKKVNLSTFRDDFKKYFTVIPNSVNDITSDEITSDTRFTVYVKDKDNENKYNPKKFTFNNTTLTALFNLVDVPQPENKETSILNNNRIIIDTTTSGLKRIKLETLLNNYLLSKFTINPNSLNNIEEISGTEYFTIYKKDNDNNISNQKIALSDIWNYNKSKFTDSTLITAKAGTNINKTGIPSVKTTTNDSGQLEFEFNYLKGDRGNTIFTGTLVNNNEFIDNSSINAIVNDLYLNTNTFNLYKCNIVSTYNGNQATWNKLGCLKGSQIYVTENDPTSNTTGNINDIIINSSTFDVHRLAAISTTSENYFWNKIGNIKGTDGSNGYKILTGTALSDEILKESTLINKSLIPDLNYKDLYLNTDTFDLYKANVDIGTQYIIIKLGCLKGQKGNDGSNGTKWITDTFELDVNNEIGTSFVYPALIGKINLSFQSFDKNNDNLLTGTELQKFFNAIGKENDESITELDINGVFKILINTFSNEEKNKLFFENDFYLNTNNYKLYKCENITFDKISFKYICTLNTGTLNTGTSTDTKTAGTIWGQTLSAKEDNNITGDMTNVGNMSFKGIANIGSNNNDCPHSIFIHSYIKNGKLLFFENVNSDYNKDIDDSLKKGFYFEHSNSDKLVLSVHQNYENNLDKFDTPIIFEANLDGTARFLKYIDFNGGAGNSGSDIRFKKNIQHINNGILEKLMKLDIISYKWCKSGETEKDTFGVTTKQLKEFGGLFSKIVHERTDEYKTEWVEYDRFGILAIAGLKELERKRKSDKRYLLKKIENQQTIIEELQRELKLTQKKQKSLENRLNKIEMVGKKLG